MRRQQKFVLAVFVLFILAGIAVFCLMSAENTVTVPAKTNVSNVSNVAFERGQISCDNAGCTVGDNWFPYN